MTPSIQDILAPLGPHWDRIIRRPMSDKEVKKLEKQVGLPAPAPLRDYLMQVGLFQDLTWWEASSIEVYDDASEFVLGRQLLAEILPAQKAELFPFGEDGAGNVFCLPTADGVPCRIHFVDHETAKVSKQKEFTAWLQAVVAKVLRGIRRRPPNDRKAWCVQFTFRGNSFADLTKLLSSVGKVKSVDSDWTNRDVSPEGVTSTERRLELNGVRLKVSRLEHRAWDSPLLSFDMREPLQQGLEHSQIRVLDGLFKKKCPGYALVDYGPLDLSEDDMD
jgi:hypothetical protein